MALWRLNVAFASDEDDFEQTQELDGRRYKLRFTWNKRDEAWRLSVYQPDGTPLALSRKIVLNIPLLNGEIDDRLPLGWIMAVDSTGADVDPGHDDLGGRVVLLYFDADYLATGQ